MLLWVLMRKHAVKPLSVATRQQAPAQCSCIHERKGDTEAARESRARQRRGRRGARAHRAVDALAVQRRRQARHDRAQRRPRDEEVDDEAREHGGDEAGGPLLRAAHARLRQHEQQHERVEASEEDARDGRDLEEEVQANRGACARRLRCWCVRLSPRCVTRYQHVPRRDDGCDDRQHIIQAGGQASAWRTEDHREVERDDRDLGHRPEHDADGAGVRIAADLHTVPVAESTHITCTAFPDCTFSVLGCTPLAR
jgi:hypothetical protein